MVEYLRLTAPGFVFSVGIPPAAAAAALAGIRILKAEPWRAAALRDRGRLFLELARAERLDTGLSRGYGVVPVITGNSELALRLSHALFEDGVNVYPIVAPAVPEQAARLRFFLSCAHTEAQIQHTVKMVAHHGSRLKATV